MKKVIHINQHHIKHNRKNKKKLPVVTVKTYKSNTYANSVEVLGACRVIYSPEKPLECGATVWIETQGKVVLDGRTTIA